MRKSCRFTNKTSMDFSWSATYRVLRYPTANLTRWHALFHDEITKALRAISIKLWLAFLIPTTLIGCKLCVIWLLVPKVLSQSPYVTKRENANIFQSYRIEPGSLQGWKLDNNSDKDSIAKWQVPICDFVFCTRFKKDKLTSLFHHMNLSRLIDCLTPNK